MRRIGCAFSGSCKRLDDLGRWYTCHHGIHGGVTYHAADDVVFRVTKNRERQTELHPHRLRLVGSIHRDSRHARARRLNLRKVLPVIRQLAEAERSPVPAIKEQDQSPMRHQIRQPLRLPLRVGQFEFRCKCAGGGDPCHRPILAAYSARADPSPAIAGRRRQDGDAGFRGTSLAPASAAGSGPVRWSQVGRVPASSSATSSDR